MKSSSDYQVKQKVCPHLKTWKESSENQWYIPNHTEECDIGFEYLSALDHTAWATNFPVFLMSQKVFYTMYCTFCLKDLTDLMEKFAWESQREI